MQQVDQLEAAREQSRADIDKLQKQLEDAGKMKAKMKAKITQLMQEKADTEAKLRSLEGKFLNLFR